ncbi:hypothetical protein DPMN_113884 [Dreissena polymorpha]|uniref:Uncharacterized protein n=1 Tax=Dreissena polymorpha TaxID=45954 RepID=A0A9D4QS96_DREPO|nr:hypothetical protein DPMN_113884 [Dreissena polymorpha]
MPSGHLQETPRQSATLPENLPDRRGTGPSGQPQETPRWCQESQRPSGYLRENSQTVCDGAKTVWAPVGYLKMVCYAANTVSSPAGDFHTVF